jgi:NAD(P)-dependent dehydrogenase (short-subunit alcohol dehydrogenase family)
MKRQKRGIGMEELSGKTALVTGSTDGVGRLVARKLGQAGARVLVHGRDAERGARVIAEIEASGGAASFLAADLSSLEEVHRLASAVQATVGRLDILITMPASAPRVRGLRLLGLAATVNEPMPDHSTD